MTNAGCRISKVRYKNSNLVEIIPRKHRYDYRRKIVRDAELLCESFQDCEMAGYALVAIGIDGTYNTAHAISPFAHFGQTIFPTLIADVLRKDIGNRSD